jgi:hypothetical protein
MPTASVKPYLSDDRTRVRLRPEVWLGALVLAALIVVAVIGPRLQPGPFVRRVRIVNHSTYAFDVDVAGRVTNGWMPLGTVGDHSAVSIGSVFQQGSTWTFRFSVQGHEVGTIVKSRADLERADWVVDVPESYAADLQSQQVVPTG